MKSYYIHLIRHGLTQANLLGQYVGSTDCALAPEGISQLEELCKKFEYPAAKQFYSSPLLRCIQTLKILYPDANATLIDDLRECDFGDWEGKTAKDLAAQGSDFVNWFQEGAQSAPPNGESGVQFRYRVCRAFESIVQHLLRTGTTSAVIVTHGGVIMNLLAAYGLPKANFYEWMTDNGCGYTLQITPGLWMRSMVAEVCQTLPRLR